MLCARELQLGTVKLAIGAVLWPGLSAPSASHIHAGWLEELQPTSLTVLNTPKCYLRRYLNCTEASVALRYVSEKIGGCTRIRTLDPLIKSHAFPQ